MRIILFLLFLLLTNLGISQNPYHITIDKTSGLPSNSVYDIFQDSKGFMWFATGKGLCRYDGNEFTLFTADFQTSKSGSCIQEDKYGRIWYENFDGFLNYIENNELKALKQNKPIGYFRYGINDDHIQVLEENGIQFYDLKTLKPSKKINLKLNHLQFAFYTHNTLYIFDEKLNEIDATGNIKSYSYPNNFIKEFNAPIVQKTTNGIVIISKYTNDYCFFENGKFKEGKFNFPTEFIQNLASTNDNNLWLCTTKGIIHFNTKTLKETKYFSDKNISFIYIDSLQNHWISTINEGVLFIENFDTKIIETNSKPNILTHSNYGLLAGLENDIVIKLNPQNNTYQTIYQGNLNHGVNQLFHDKKSNTSFLTSSKFKIISHNKVEEFLLGAVKSIAKIDDKYFSFAASNASGIFTNNLNLKSNWDSVFKKYAALNTNSSSKINLVYNVNGKSTTYNPKNETIYFATNNGLIAFSKNEKKEIKYNNKTIFFTKIEYYNGITYGLTSNEKLYTISIKNQIKPFVYPANFTAVTIEKISIENNLLFAYTPDAIYEINLNNNTYKKIITLNKETTISDVKFLNNNYYFASSKGIIIKKREEEKIISIPKLFINKILINDEKIISPNNTELNYTENNIKINFTVLSFIPNEKFKVLYSINNSKWNTLDAENRNLILSSLSPDDYEIKLKIDTKNSTEIKTIHFKIKKPFWLNTFFLIGIGILFLVLIYSFYKWQIRKLKRKNELLIEKVNLEKNLNQSKLKAIKSQMNPHFFYNALNTLQSYILSNEKKQAIEYLSKFSNLTRTILELTEKDYISVNEEIKTLKLYLDIEKARFEDDFKYEINTNSDLDNEHIKIPSMMLQPYVENAIKHGLLHKKDNKELKISFEKNNDILKITIDDNGIGRQKSGELNTIKNKNHNSFATEAMQNRIDLLNQYNHNNISIVITDKTNFLKQSIGTTVTFKIPISY